MIRGFAILLGCQLLGELIARASGWPVPGNVLIARSAGIGGSPTYETLKAALSGGAFP